MSATLKWRLGLGFVVVFFAGVALGLFGGAWHARHIFFGGRPGHFHQRMREQLQRELKLTPEQEQQVTPILDHMTQEMDRLRAESGQHVRQTLEESHRQILPFLTPEQQEKLAKMRERHERQQREHGGPPPPPAPSDEPPPVTR